LHHNLIHDVESLSYGGWGIYFDEGTTHILAENNVVYRTKTGGFHQHYGKENMVRNNVFAFAREGQIQRSRPEEHLSFTFERNIVYWREGPLLHGNWGDNQYKLDYNLYWREGGGEVQFTNLTLEQWRAKGQDAHSVIADPLFARARQGRFSAEARFTRLANRFSADRHLEGGQADKQAEGRRAARAPCVSGGQVSGGRSPAPATGRRGRHRAGVCNSHH
jgi:hypothetical protein